MKRFFHIVRVVIGKTLLIALALGIASCAGRRKAENCLSARDEILDETDAIMCNPMSIHQFETRVNSWGKDCHALISKQDNTKVFEKLQYAMKCAEKRRQTEAKAKQCAEELRQVKEKGSECIGAACDPHVSELKRLLEKCSDPALGRMYKLEAEKLLPLFEERAANEAILGELNDTAAFCDEQAIAAAEGDPQRALKRLVKAIKKNKVIKNTPEAGTEIERFTKKALASCGLAVQTAVATMVEAAETILSSEENPPSAVQSRRAYKQLLKLRKPLKKIRAEELFPGSTESLQTALDKYK